MRSIWLYVEFVFLFFVDKAIALAALALAYLYTTHHIGGELTAIWLGALLIVAVREHTATTRTLRRQSHAPYTFCKMRRHSSSYDYRLRELGRTAMANIARGVVVGELYSRRGSYDIRQVRSPFSTAEAQQAAAEYERRKSPGQ